MSRRNIGVQVRTCCDLIDSILIDVKKINDLNDQIKVCSIEKDYKLLQLKATLSTLVPEDKK